MTLRTARMLAGVALLALLQAGPPGQAPRVMRAADFLETLGVNTHVGSDPYNDPAAVAALLGRLGVAHVRQTSPIGRSDLEAMQALGRAGAKFDMVVNGGGEVKLAGAMDTLRAMAPWLVAIEGVNEAAIWPITYQGLGGVAAAVALQKDLFAAARGDPALSHAAVLVFTLGGIDPEAFPEIGDLSAHADYANIHSYPPHGMRPIFVIHAAIAGGRTSAAQRPVMVTETGYYTLPDHAGWGGVTEAVQASYLMGLLLDQAAAGVARTYLYDLIDDKPDPERTDREAHFGLFRHDLSPKPSATGIGNMVALLADEGPRRKDFELRDFAFLAQGVPYGHTGNTLVLAKSDGTRIVAVWNQQQLWDPDTRKATPARKVRVEMVLPRGRILVHDPIAGAGPIMTLEDASRLVLELEDRPLFVVLPPAQD